MSLIQPTATLRPSSLPLSLVTYWAYINLCVNLQSKDGDYSLLKLGGGVGWGGHGSLDDGCHGFLSKAFGIMAHPLLMSVLEEEGGGEEGVERDGGRDEGKGRGGEAACCS